MSLYIYLFIYLYLYIYIYIVVSIRLKMNWWFIHTSIFPNNYIVVLNAPIYYIYYGVHTGHLNLGSVLFFKILYNQMFGYCSLHSLIRHLCYEFHTILILVYIPVCSLEPIHEFIYRLTGKFYHNCSTHPNPLVCQIGNYTSLGLHVQYRKYIHKRIKHLLL